MSGYADRLHDLTVELLRLITATTQADISWSLLNVLVTLWFLVAVMLSLKTTRGLLLGSTLSAALIIAYANKVYGAGYAERYIMYMLPIAFVAMALAVEAAWRRLRVARVPSAVARAAALLGLVLLGWYAVRAWLTLDGYYQTEIAQGRSNQPQLAWNDLAQPYARDGYRVLVGTRLDNEFVVQFGSTYGLVQMYLLRMQGFAPSMVSRDDIRRIIEQNPEIRNLLLLERTGEYAVLRTQVPLCVVSGLPGRVMAVYKGAPCQ